MFNILPQEEKKKVLTEYRLRLAVVVVFAVAALVLSSCILLVPSYLLAVSKYNFAAKELATLEGKQVDGGKEKEIDTQIKAVNKKISLFLGDKKAIARTPSEAILSVLSVKNFSIKIRSVLYDVNPDREHLVFMGRAEDRDSLASFVEILKKDPSWNSVDLPIGSYVKSTNIDFTIVLERTIRIPQEIK